MIQIKKEITSFFVSLEIRQQDETRDTIIEDDEVSEEDQTMVSSLIVLEPCGRNQGSI